MSLAPATRNSARRQWLGLLPPLALALAVAALVLLAAGPLGWRAGWWHYRVGLQILMPAAAYTGLAAGAIAVPALALAAIRVLPRRALLPALAALLVGGVALYYPWHWHNERGTGVRVNDVTTDTANPPSLAFAKEMRQAENGNAIAYEGAEMAARQRKAYPDIAPAMLDMPPEAAFDIALSVAKAKGWTIVTADPASGTIDAFQRSRWFGFADDVAIRVTPAEGASRVDIRSAARHGRGDFGVNAARVRDYLAALRAAAAGG